MNACTDGGAVAGAKFLVVVVAIFWPYRYSPVIHTAGCDELKLKTLGMGNAITKLKVMLRNRKKRKLNAYIQS